MGQFIGTPRSKLQRERAEITNLAGEPQVCDLRLLDGTDTQWIAREAREMARRGKYEAKKGVDEHDYAVDVLHLFRAAEDADSPEDARTSFFPTVQDIYDGLDRDRVHYLVKRQQAFQERRSPLKYDLTDAELIRKCEEIAAAEDGDPRPFQEMPLSLLHGLLRILAVRLVTFLQLMSQSSGAASAAGSATTPSSAPSSE